MAIQKIDFYGQFSPTGVDTGEASLFQQAASIGSRIQERLTQDMFQEAQRTGAEEGLQSVTETGEMPALRSDYTIRGQAFNDASKLAYGAQVRTDARKQFHRMKLESQDPVEFQRRSEAYINETTKDLPIDLQAQLKSDLANASATAQMQLETDFYNRTMDENLAIVNEELEGTMDDILNAYNAGDLQQATRLEGQLEVALDEAVQTGLIKATQKQAILNAAKEESEKEVYLGEMDRIVSSALPLENRIQGAESLVQKLKDDELKYLNPRQKDALLSSLAAKASNLGVELKKAQAKTALEDSRAVSNLKVAVNTGMGEIGELMNQTEAFFDAKKISEPERTSLMTALVKRQKEELDKQARFELIAKRLSGDDTVIVDQKGVDEVYDEAIEPLLAEMPPLERNAQLANIIGETHIVPSRVKAEISNSLNTREPELAAQTLDLIDRVTDVPGIDLGISKHQEAYAQKLVELSAIMPTAEAIDLAQRATDPKDKERIALVQQEIKEKEKDGDYDYSEIVVDEIDGLNPINQEKAAKEYSQIFKSYLEAGMSEDAAQDKALRRLKANWAESEAAGMTIKNPPEQFYSVAGDSSYIREQLLRDVFAENIFGGDPEDIEVYLQSDDVTAREAAKGKPTYNVIVFTPEEGFIALPERWSPDVEAQIQKVNTQQIDRFKRLRQEATKPEARRNLEDLSTIGQGL